MLITVNYAQCDGCGRRYESSEIPPYWLSIRRTVDKTTSLFCTTLCFATSDGLASVPLATYRANRYALAPQDIAILTLVAQGKSNGEIGIALGLTVQTVKNRLTVNCGQKLGVSSRVELVLVADRLGLIDLREQAQKIVQRFPEHDELEPHTCL